MSAMLLAVLLPASVFSQVRFVEPPVVATGDKAVTITFAASAETDAEVAILDARGKVVRHLAAGSLGKNAPAPFKAGSRRQTVRWDRTDDAGKPVAGRCSVRIRLGLTGELDKQLGFDPYLWRQILGLTVSGKGELFVLDGQGTYGASGIRVYDRAGKYVRTVMPYSAELPADRLASIGQLKLTDGTRLPIVYNAHGQNLHPYTSGMKHQTMTFDPAGRLVLFSAVGTICEHGPPRHLLFLEASGAPPAEPGFIGPPILKARGFLGGAGDASARYFDHVAASPDGKWLYLSGGRMASKRHFRHVIFRVKPGEKTLPKPWLGVDRKPGADATHFNDPQGIAVDAAGRIYIADRGNDRVVVCAPGGKRLGSFAVADPLQLQVHPTGGQIYVTSGKGDKYGRMRGSFKLIKFGGFKPGGPAPKAVASIEGTGKPVVALDAGATPPKLWLASQIKGHQHIHPVIDRGGNLERGKSLLRNVGLRQPMFIAADAARGKLYVTEFRNFQQQIDLASGKVADFCQGGEAAVDRDGFVHVLKGFRPVHLLRYAPDGKPANFPGTSVSKIEIRNHVSKGPHVGFRGHTFAPNGDLYILQMKFYGDGRVLVYGRDGKLKGERALVSHLPNGSGGIAVDRAGNIFVSANVKKADRIFPADFAGQVSGKGWRYWRRPRPAPWDRPYYNPYLYHWGSVFKFGPAGGAFHPGFKEVGKGGRDAVKIPAGATRFKSGYLDSDVGVTGALWHFRGYGPVPPGNLNWGDPSCTCMGARFSVDDFGRLYVPDAFRFAVNVLDPAGNLIGRIGRYGNPDDPGIRLAWSAYVAAADGKLYISDMANRRVTAVNISAAAVGVADVPAAK